MFLRTHRGDSHRYPGRRQPGRKRRVQSNRTTLAVGDATGITLWDVTTGQTDFLSQIGITSVAFSPDSKTLAAGDDRGQIGLWDLATERLTAKLDESGLPSVTFSPDGRTIAAGDGESDGHVGLWDVATGRHIATLAEGSLVESVAFSQGGK